MRRARVRVALIVVVLGVLTGIGFLLGRSMLQQRGAAERTEKQVFAPDVAQSIREFHRVKVEDGRTVWDLRAEKADFLDEGRVVVELPELAFFADDGQSVRLSGVSGEVVLDGTKVGRIDLKGGIEVSVGQYRLETPEASWIDSMNTVVAPSGVDLSGSGVTITGDVMIVELEKRRVLVVGDVKTVLTRTAEARGAATEGMGAPRPSSQPSGEGVPLEDPGAS